MTSSEKTAREPMDAGKPTPAVTQKQEDLLLELFFQLSVTDRKQVIRYIRDLIQTASEKAAD